MTVAALTEMWSNIAAVVTKASSHVQNLQREIESQLDAAVGKANLVTDDDVLLQSTVNTQVPAADTNTADETVGKGVVDDSFDEIDMNSPEKTNFQSNVLKSSKVSQNEETQKKNVADEVAKMKDALVKEITKTEKEKYKVQLEKSRIQIAEEISKKEKEKHAVELDKLKSSLTTEINQSIKMKFDKELEALQTNHNNKLTELQQQHVNALNQANEKKKEVISTIKSSHSNELAALKRQHMELLDEEKKKHNTILEEEQLKHKLALDEALERINTNLVSTGNEDLAKEIELRRSVEEERNALQNKMRQLQAKYDDSVTLQASEIAELKEKHETEIKSLNEEIQSLHDDFKSRASAAEADLLQKENALKQLTEQVADLQRSAESHASDGLEEKNLQLTADLQKAREIIVDRERALETVNVKMAENIALIGSLQASLDESNAKLNSQAASANDGNKKQILMLQETLKTKNEQLAAYELEGQDLAKKQGEMEKLVKKVRGEMKEKDNEIKSLKESKEQLVKAIEEIQELMRAKEQEASGANKTLSAMQAVSQASTDKISKLESELASKIEEISSQRRALDSAWNENSEFKRSITELRAERDDLKKQIGEGTSKVIETESNKRDIEQREAVLKATNKQLQDSLQRQMSESSLREERLREEINDMRKRWNEAITSRDTLASELGNTTTPLLRQISSLQESLRIKSENWQGIESSLSERALRAESACEMAEHKRALMEEQLNDMKSQLTHITSKYNETTIVLNEHELLIDKLKKTESSLNEKNNELESRLQYEYGQKQSSQTSLRELELRYRLDVQEQKEIAENSAKVHELKVTALNKEIAELNQLLQQQQQHLYLPAKANEAVVESSPTTPTSSLKSKYSNHSLNALLPNGDASYAAQERFQQYVHQKDEELSSRLSQISQLEASRNALLEEVSYLSSRNAELEEKVLSVPGLHATISELQSKSNILLNILGEKDEELEATLDDMKEVKYMYRAQLEELLEKIAPEKA